MKRMIELIQVTGIPIGTEPEQSKPRFLTSRDFGLDRQVMEDAAWRLNWLKAASENRHPEIYAMFQAAERVIKGWLCGDQTTPHKFILTGKIGTGKSTLARRMIRVFGDMAPTAYWDGYLAQGWSATAMEWSKLANLGPADRGAESCWIDAEEADPLLLDDIGTEVDRFRSGAALENLRLILESRRRKRTIITTNILPALWTKVFDVRVADRLHRNAMIVEVRNAPSYTIT